MGLAYFSIFIGILGAAGIAVVLLKARGKSGKRRGSEFGQLSLCFWAVSALFSHLTF